MKNETKSFINVKIDWKLLDTQSNDMYDNDKYFYIKGYASVFGNVDYGKDMIKQGAFAESLVKKPEVTVLYQHNMNKPIGRSILMKEDDKGLYIEARFPRKSDFISKELIPQIEIGNLQELSIGFFIKDADYIDDIRIIKQVDLFEFSIVTMAMNPEATVTGYKSIEEIANIRDAEKFLKLKGLSGNDAKKIISKISEIKTNSKCDAEELKSQRDAELLTNLNDKINNLTQFLKTN